MVIHHNTPPRPTAVIAKSGIGREIIASGRPICSQERQTTHFPQANPILGLEPDRVGHIVMAKTQPNLLTTTSTSEVNLYFRSTGWPVHGRFDNPDGSLVGPRH
jgi:hypothetical protein